MNEKCPEIRLLQEVILRAFADAMNNVDYILKIQAANFLTSEYSCIYIYLDVLGIEPKVFKEKARKILDATIDNFCTEEQKEAGMQVFMKNSSWAHKKKPLNKQRDYAIRALFNNYIDREIKFSLNSGD